MVHLAAFDTTSALTCLALFGASYVQEGAALAGGAMLILGNGLPPVWVGLSLYLGIVTGDCCIFGLGTLARQNEWARQKIAGVNLERTRTWVNNGLPVAIAASHLIPWLLFPAFVTLGWLAVPFRRFALTSALFNVIYVPLALVILTTAGNAAWPHFKSNAWILCLVVGVVATVSVVLWHRRTRR